MPVFLVTCVCDEGLGERSFRVVEAESRLEVAESIRSEPHDWMDFLRRSDLWDGVHEQRWSATELLSRIDASLVDGDSQYQLSVLPITRIERCWGGEFNGGEAPMSKEQRP